MTKKITGKSDVDILINDDCESPIFKSREEMNQSLSRLCYGNFHVIGSLWMEALKKVLVGKKMCIIPTVEAAEKKEDKSKKPPRMRYKELPLYENPHAAYKEHQEEEEIKCIGKNKKLLQSMLHPTVVGWRKSFISTGCGLSCFFSECFCELRQDIVHQLRCFKCCMRSKDNYQLRVGVVAAATSAGLIYGFRKSRLPTVTAFWAAVGALSAGALCFPKETDEQFRNACHELQKAFLVIFNIWNGSYKTLSNFGPCEKEMPPQPPKRTVDKKHQCVKPPPPKKK